MLNNDKNSMRQIAGLGIAMAVTLSGMALAAPAAGGEPRKEVIEKRVIIGGERDHAEHGALRDHKCPGELVTVESAPAGSDQKKEKAKIAICSKTGDKAEIAAGLEKALARLEKDSDMDAALRADMSAKLRAKIAELRGQ